MMKQMTCEMCGSTDLAKEDGFVVCQSCGTKYSNEEAKKLMIEGTVEVTGTVTIDKSDNAEALITRAFMFLEDGEWYNADEYFEKVLDIDPKSVQAYLGKLMAELKVKRQDDLKEYAQPFDISNNYQKIMRFADDALKSELQGYVEYIKTRNKNTIASLLERAFMFLENEDWNIANGYCDKVLDIDFTNAQAYLGKLMAECEACTPSELSDCDEPFDNSNNYKKAFLYGNDSLKSELKGYLEDIKNAPYEATYICAIKAIEAASTEYAHEFKRAAELFDSIAGYKDSTLWAQKCRSFILLIQAGLKFEFTKTTCTITGRAENCYSHTFTIPDYVTEIGDSAFVDTFLESIVLPNTLTTIGSCAFKGTKLFRIVIPEGVTSIGNEAFDSCKLLENVTLPSTLITIGDNAFNDCKDLKNIIFPDKLTKIGSGAFTSCQSLRSVTIPEGVTSIGKDAFAKCVRIAEVYILSPSLTTANSGDYSYWGLHPLKIHTSRNDQSNIWTTDDGFVFFEDGENCFLLDYIASKGIQTLPTSCNGKNYAIFSYAFNGKTNLTTLTIPNSVTSIGDSAFSNSNIRSIVIPDSVTSIGHHAFCDCLCLWLVQISNPQICDKSDAFYGCYQDKLNITFLNEKGQWKTVTYGKFIKKYLSK